MNDKESRIAPKGLELVSPAFEGLPEHWRIASRAVEDLSGDDRVLGLYLAGSFASGQADRWSDIDLYVVVPDGQADELISSHSSLIREIADVATLFPATHLGDRHQIIVFYKAGDEPIHVDYQYREVSGLKPRQKDAEVVLLLDRAGHLARWQDACRHEPELDRRTPEELQHLEDRFWAWCWYTHSKIKRGELWEARKSLEYIRDHVLLPLAHGEDQPFEGNRRLETKLPRTTQDLLAETIPASHSVDGYAQALAGSMDAYSRLFEAIPRHERDGVQIVDRTYFQEAIGESE